MGTAAKPTSVPIHDTAIYVLCVDACEHGVRVRVTVRVRDRVNSNPNLLF